MAHLAAIPCTLEGAAAPPLTGPCACCFADACLLLCCCPLLPSAAGGGMHLQWGMMFLPVILTDGKCAKVENKVAWWTGIMVGGWVRDGFGCERLGGSAGGVGLLIDICGRSTTWPCAILQPVEQ